MARERMVTRTITTNEVCVLVYNLTESKTEDRIVNITGARLTEEEAEKLVKKLYKDNDTEKFIMIEKMNYYEKLFGMSEARFIELAEVLPNR